MALALGSFTKRVKIMARTRINRTNRHVGAPAKAAITKKLNAASIIMQEIADKQKELATLQVEIEDGMKKAGMDRHEVDTAVAEIKSPQGKSTTVIDKKAFLDKVGMDDFMECASVGVTKAKKVLSEKELASVSETIPPKAKDPVLKITLK